MHIFKGYIQQGRGRASMLGFPTVNIPMAHSNVSGIFVARVSFRKKVLPAVAYADPDREILEAHLLDGSLIPNGEIALELLEKIRESSVFADEAALRAAIAADVGAAKRYFGL